MQNYAKQIQVSNNVLFLDYVENIGNYLELFQIILFTSDYEELPLTIWEAMDTGVPIVSTDVGGIKEIIENEN
ncbi:MAG: hypothetical protein STSR0008_26320 [Ignavibacterium sp.]